MSEPQRLLLARQHLSRAEAEYQSADGLFHLEEGLALLDEVIAGDSSEFHKVAQNLASAYSTRIYACIRRLVDTDRAIPEPLLEHLFKVALAFDHYNFDLPAEARSTKIKLVRDLIDRYYEGHPPDVKRAAVEKLAAITRKRK